MRYQGNVLRVWFTSEEGLGKPIAEVPIVKDKWLSNEVEVLAYLPMPDDIALPSARILFGEEVQGLQARYPNSTDCIKQQSSASATAPSG
jgi:hypothetical protein